MALYAIPTTRDAYLFGHKRLRDSERPDDFSNVFRIIINKY